MATINKHVELCSDAKEKVKHTPDWRTEWLPKDLESERPLVSSVTETTINHEREPHCCGCLNGYIVTQTTNPITWLMRFFCNECGEEIARGSWRHFGQGD